MNPKHWYIMYTEIKPFLFLINVSNRGDLVAWFFFCMISEKQAIAIYACKKVFFFYIYLWFNTVSVKMLEIATNNKQQCCSSDYATLDNHYWYRGTTCSHPQNISSESHGRVRTYSSITHKRSPQRHLKSSLHIYSSRGYKETQCWETG